VQIIQHLLQNKFPVLSKKYITIQISGDLYKTLFIFVRKYLRITFKKKKESWKNYF